MKYQLGCELKYRVKSPATFIFNVAAAETAYQSVVEEKISSEPEISLEELLPRPEGNRFHRLNAEIGDLNLSYLAVIDHTATEIGDVLAEVPIGALPSTVIQYLYPSRYCPSDKLLRLADRVFGEFNPGSIRVTAICNWIYSNVEYLRGNSDEHTSAADTLIERVGVCRDFAHLGISLCRALGIPARFLTAYAYQLAPPDFHACFEAFLDGRWYVFDPTRLAPPSGFVRIGVGRDAADTSFATIYGDVEMIDMKVTMEVKESKSNSVTANNRLPTFTTASIGIS